jgi:uncharacterized membrane protein YoaK (UPF0700 family)
MENPEPPSPRWKIILASILDSLLAFLAFGTIIAKLTGNKHGIGWNLTGWPAAALLAMIIAYFVVGNGMFGGTVFKRLLGIRKGNQPPPPTWREVFAAIFDFFLVFALGGYFVAKLTGNTHQYGFTLEGLAALAAFALIAAYFVIGNRYFGGTVFKHIFGTARKR